jgi:thioredoxin-like negative regulator of GroEL
MRRMYLVAAAEQPSNPLAGLLGRDNDFVKHAEEFRQMPILLNAGKPKEAVEIYDSLPTQMKTEKTVMLLYVLAAERIDDATYTDAIDRFRQQHPDDPCLDMVSIDGYVLRAQYDEALRAVDRVDEAVGGDPYMNVVRANIHRMQGDLTTSAALAQQAMDQDPKLVDAYWALLTVSLEENEFGETANWLTTIREKFDIEFNDIRGIPDYAEFLESPEYAEWSKEETFDTQE